ncbi:hypothetical protein JCM8547_005335 [Rhodosporidiobolus lusitaniae]
MAASAPRHLLLSSSARPALRASLTTCIRLEAAGRSVPSAQLASATSPSSSASSSHSSPSSPAVRGRGAHHVASSTVPFSARGPPPPPPPAPPRPSSSHPIKPPNRANPPPPSPRDPSPWTNDEYDLHTAFSASLQASLAEDWALQQGLEKHNSIHPKWDLDGREPGLDEAVFEGDHVAEGDEGDGGMGFVLSQLGEFEIGQAIEGGEEGEEGWVDWRELLEGERAGGLGAPREARREEKRAIDASLREGEGQGKVERRRPVKAREQEEEVVLPASPAPSASPSLEQALPPASSTSLVPPFVRTNPFAVPLYSTPVPRRSKSQPFELKPAERLTYTSFSPYIPPRLPSPPPQPSPSSSASPPTSQPFPDTIEPHHHPLLTRTDWRLSSPLRRYLRTHPPPLFSLSETATMPLGHGRLVGVGTDAARIGRKGVSRGEEQWGWKVKVPAEREMGGWEAADVYTERMTRLLTLSRASDELTYQSSLARSGTPEEREKKGLTVCRALGVWLSDTSRLDEPVVEGEGEGRMGGREKGGEKGAKVVAEWRREEGGELSEEEGWKFPEGTILRFTRSPPSPSSFAPLPPNPTGPQPPLNGGALASSAAVEQWFVQGTVLEEREGRLIVSFEEEDMWRIGEEEAYQIDLGLDTSSYTLQETGLQNLYLDPSRQRLRNADHIAQLQSNFLQAHVAGTPREWTLQGTELREIIVPHLPSPSSSPHDPSLPSLSPSATDTAASTHPSSLLRSNQLINSWIQRYSRPGPPLAMPGDPELGLNESQTRAIAMGLGERLSLIQGPPGTGKSQTIVSLIALLKLHFRVPFPILLAAPTHVSVDHLLSLLVKLGLNPLRCGKASKVSNPEAEKWTIEKRQEQHPLWKRMEMAREESEGLREEVVELRGRAVEGGERTEQKRVEKEGFELEEKYRKAWRKFVMLEQKLYASLLATADVFCATALGAGTSKVLSMVDFPLVLLDEAAMCTEPVSLIPLMKGAQHAVLIGDHKQLPAVVTSQEAKNERLHISLFERLLASETVKSTLLDTQYRMRPDISAFPNLSFYHSALRDAHAVSERPPPPKSRFFSSPAPSVSSSLAPRNAFSPSPPIASADKEDQPISVAFVSHTGPEYLHRRSFLNRSEADLLTLIVGDLLLQNPSLRASDIGIISPYYAQTRLLINTFESGFASSRLRGMLDSTRAAEASEVEVNTVDGFQGREKRVILLSTVRSNKAGQIGFLTDRRRLNVALTRARDALIVVGNQETLRRAASNEWTVAAGGAAADPDADAGVWRRFLSWCERRGLVREYKKDEQDEQ